jgi:nucleotide-binding universal stress UspA family protein
MKTILVPTDLSENAENALLYAAAMANSIHANLLLIHVLYIPENSEGNIPEDLEGQPKIKECQDKLVTLVHRIQNQHQYYFAFETLCIFGEDLNILHDIVKTKNVQLVVMGTQGCSNYFDNLIGSNTSDFIKKAQCPVLAIPAKARFKGVNKIVYASDFTTDETLYLKQLFVFARLFLAEVLILNIETGELLKNPSDHEIIDKVTPTFSGLNYTIFRVEEEDVSQGILHFTENNHVEMLAIAIHQRSVFEDLFHSSIAKTLVFHSSVPLLSLPEKPYHMPPPTGTVEQIKADLLKK